MNNAEQKHHRTVTGELRKDLDDLAEAFDKELKETEETLRKMIGDERTHRLKLAEEQHSYVDEENRAMTRRVDAFMHALNEFLLAPWYRRWWWVLTGRM